MGKPSKDTLKRFILHTSKYLDFGVEKNMINPFRPSAKVIIKKVEINMEGGGGAGGKGGGR